MNIIQQFLQKKSFKDLEDEHNIVLSFSKDRKKVSLNYHQIEAKDNDQYACTARGMILGLPNCNPFPLEYKSFIPGDTIVIAHPFNRFFNLGQEAAQIKDLNRKDLSVQNKLDGTLIIAYYCPINNKWMVATRSVPEADIQLQNGMTFSTLWNNTHKEIFGFDFESNNLDKGSTYIFELCTPYNQIVVVHEKPSIYLLGARNLLSGKEWMPLTIYPVPEKYNLSSHDEIIKFVNGRYFRDFEGVVVCDSNFNRVKIKSPDYCNANKLLDLAGSERAIMSYILDGKYDDIVSILHPFVKLKCDQLLDAYRAYVKFWKINFEHMKNIALKNYPDFDQNKAFAFALNDNKISWKDPYFFCFRKGLSWDQFIVSKKQEVNGKVIYPSIFLDAVLNSVKEFLK